MHDGPTHDARKQKTIGMWSSKSHTLEKLFSAAGPCVRAHLPCPPLNSRASEQRTASQHKTPYTGLLDVRTTPLFFPAGLWPQSKVKDLAGAARYQLSAISWPPTDS